MSWKGGHHKTSRRVPWKNREKQKLRPVAAQLLDLPALGIGTIPRGSAADSTGGGAHGGSHEEPSTTAQGGTQWDGKPEGEEGLDVTWDTKRLDYS